MHADASKVLLLEVDGESWDVPPERCFRIGRHKANDLVLRDHTASRFHLQIVWIGGQAFVEDLHSANGTFLEGRRVKGRVPIRPGQRLLVGDSKIDVEVAEEHPALLHGEGDEVSLFTEITAPPVEGTFTRKDTLHRLLLDLEWEERTGTLELSMGVRKARIVFSLGRVAWVRHQQLDGFPALERILRAAVGDFRFKPTFEPLDAEVLDVSPREFLQQGYWSATKRHARKTKRLVA